MRRHNTEFYKLVIDILNNKEFNKLKYIDHHGITRYDHSLRVAYYTYIVTKKLHLNYKQATKAALLHDFFTDEVSSLDQVSKLRKHPHYALENAKKYYELSALEEDIIKCHMFPVTLTPPKYIESWLVDFIDDVAAIYERSFTLKNELSTSVGVLAIALINFIGIR